MMLLGISSIFFIFIGVILAFIAQVLRTWSVEDFGDVAYTIVLSIGVGMILIGLFLIFYKYFTWRRTPTVERVETSVENCHPQEISETPTVEMKETTVEMKSIDIIATIPEVTNVAKKTPRKYNQTYKRKMVKKN